MSFFHGLLKKKPGGTFIGNFIRDRWHSSVFGSVIDYFKPKKDDDEE